MTELEFNRGEIEELAQKLDSPQAQLSKRERELLLAIFEVARGNVSLRIPAKGSGHAESTLANLQEQILNAFIPGEDNDFIIQFRIGLPPPPPVPPPPDSPPDSPSTPTQT